MKYIILVFMGLWFVSCDTVKNDERWVTDTIEDIDGNIYNTIKIGSQWWMAENLRVTRYNNGDSLLNFARGTFEFIGDSLGAYTSFGSDNVIVERFGLLYNWLAVDDPRGLCPVGWRVPSDEDWMVLERNVLDIKRRELELTGWRGTGAGRLKENDTLSWRHPNVGANNTSGFTARAGGYAVGISYNHLYSIGYWWTSTVHREEELPIRHKTAYNRELNFYNDRMSRFYKFTFTAMSVRCIKDE